VNWSEVAQKLLARGAPAGALLVQLRETGLRVGAFDADDAEAAAALWPTTSALGLSLADRACLALGLRLGLPVLTADRSWLDVELGVRVEPIR